MVTPRYTTHSFVWVRKDIIERLKQQKEYSTEPIGEVIARHSMDSDTTDNYGVKFKREVETVSEV
tara:strand:+ start:1024 stop:1218 length:195 start_codon:yes stop_codon:yes gene_type:complete